MTAREKSALVHRLQEGKRKARALKPQRLAECEGRIDQLSTEHRTARARRDIAGAVAILRQLETEGVTRHRLKYGD